MERRVCIVSAAQSAVLALLFGVQNEDTPPPTTPPPHKHIRATRNRNHVFKEEVERLTTVVMMITVS